MTWVTWERLASYEKARPKGYREAMLREAICAGIGGFCLPDAGLARLRLKYPSGAGDIVAGLLGAMGVHSEPGCGCDQRRESLNKLLPLG